MNKFILLLLIWGSLLSLTGFSQEVLRLDDGMPAGKGTLSELNWLEGYWQGTGFDGSCDEVWMPATDNQMHGIFRFTLNDSVQFTEYLIIEEIDSTLKIKLKHFGRDLTPWENKEKWTTFDLIKIEGETAYFNGLTYHLEGDKLTVRLLLYQNSETSIEDFVFVRKNL
ncbi:MAG: DUF6265 family protein [Brumimicrobium sp.]|nr:DUF6265 family protein [Brumimicrobium sp.]